MKTLVRIRKFAEKNGLLFRDYRFDGLLNPGEEVNCRYELLYVNSFKSFRSFKNQQEIEEFLSVERE